MIEATNTVRSNERHVRSGRMCHAFLACRGVTAGLIAILGATVGCGGSSPTGPSAPPTSGFTVSAISPNTGGVDGATDVTINGTGFQIGARVTFDGIVASATVNTAPPSSRERLPTPSGEWTSLSSIRMARAAR